MANSGDLVKIETKDEAFEGVLMPEEKENVILKLKSGYNVGIDKSKIKKISLLEKRKETKPATLKLDQNKSLPKISILHTGGTIASKVDYETGGVISRTSPEELLGMFPELKSIANIRSVFVRSMWSEDIRFSHYNILAKIVEKEIKDGADGVIIAHGTDTLHYTGAALSFMLQGLSVPVVLVGAQRSSDRASSDAGVNLLSAAFFIASNKDFSQVSICMHENISDDWCVILPGTKTRKMHSSSRNAFKAINSKPFARVNFNQKKVDWIVKKQQNSLQSLQVLSFKENIKVALLKTHTNMFAKQFDFFEDYDGLVVEGFGIAGNIPINEIDDLTKEHTKITNSLKKLIKKGVVIATTTQTIYGGVNMNVYSTGRKMQELGVLGNHTDMHPETAFIKLAWLLSNFKNHEVKELYSKNLRGELSENLSVSEE